MERGRVIRLRSLVPAERLGGGQPAPSQTPDEDPVSIAAFLTGLDRELAESVDWNVPTEFAEHLSGDQQEAIRNLLRGIAELPDTGARIQAEVLALPGGWRLSLSGDGSGMTEAMRGLFSGTHDAGRWASVQGSLRAIAARLTVERSSDMREKVHVDFSPRRR
jgi:hypothetical protein